MFKCRLKLFEKILKLYLYFHYFDHLVCVLQQSSKNVEFDGKKLKTFLAKLRTDSSWSSLQQTEDWWDRNYCCCCWRPDHPADRRQPVSASHTSVRSPARNSGWVWRAADRLEAEKSETVRQGHLFVFARGRRLGGDEWRVLEGGVVVGRHAVGPLVVVVVHRWAEGEDGRRAEVLQWDSHLKFVK